MGTITTRYFAPLAALSLVSSQLLDMQDHPKLSYFLGKDLAEVAPAHELTLRAPPVISSASTLLQSAVGLMKAGTVDEKLQHLQKAAMSTAKTFIPGMAPINEYLRMRKAFGLGDGE